MVWNGKKLKQRQATDRKIKCKRTANTLFVSIKSAEMKVGLFCHHMCQLRL